MDAKEKTTLGRTALEIWITLLFLLIMHGIVWGAINAAYEKHLLIGLVVTLSLPFVIWMGLVDLRKREDRISSAQKAFRIFCLTTLTTAAAFGSISYFLSRVGLEYSSMETFTFGYFYEYYVWIFFDLLPGLNVSETLGVALHRPQGAWAALPVIFFRVFVIYVLFASLKIWWDGRKPDEALLLMRKIADNLDKLGASPST